MVSHEEWDVLAQQVHAVDKEDELGHIPHQPSSSTAEMKPWNHVHTSNPSWDPEGIGVGQEGGWEATIPLRDPSSTIKRHSQEPKRWLSPQEAAKSDLTVINISLGRV